MNQTTAYQYDMTDDGITAKAAEMSARLGGRAAAAKAWEYSRWSGKGSVGRRFWLAVVESVVDANGGE